VPAGPELAVHLEKCGHNHQIKWGLVQN
jgi:hypothetical protein